MEFSILVQCLVGLMCWAKCSFHSGRAMCLSNLQKNILNHYPEHEIWINWLLFWVKNLNFKIRKVIWNIFVWRFDKPIGLSKKNTFSLENREKKSRKILGNWRRITEVNDCLFSDPPMQSSDWIFFWSQTNNSIEYFFSVLVNIETIELSK